MDLTTIYAQLQQQTKDLMSHPFHPLWNQLNLMSAMQQMPTNAAATALLQQQAQMAQMPSNPYALPGYGVDFNAWAMSAGLPHAPFNSSNMSNMFAAVNSPTPSPPFALSYPNTPTPDYHHLNLSNVQKQQLQSIHPQHQLYGNHVGALMMQSPMTTPVDDQGVSIYPCNLCDKRFQKPWHLRTHLAGVHYQLRPHKCAECPMAFRSPYDLKRHQTTHTGERFECDSCNISFGSKQRIAKHIRENPSCWIDSDGDMEDHPTRVTANTSASSSTTDSSIAAQPTSPNATQLNTSSSSVGATKLAVRADSESILPPPATLQSLHHSVVSDTDSDHSRTEFDDDDEPIITDV